ncbi:MAG: hypothetical protein C6H99_02190 [Epsilonproteobacteria bacterium]|nr:hypothetical protein [Campylobacterota bacterium]NPA64062.1 LysR family transcriptional regulator [Campylobacterota bacterium]
MELELVWKEGDRLFLDQKRAELLESIQKHGSLSKAAKECGMSYKGAWDTLQSMSQLAGTRLFESRIGGSRGGGTKLSQEALDLLKRYKEQRSKLFEKKIQHLNTLPVTIDRVKKKGDEVLVWGLFGSYRLKARVLGEAWEELGLQEGQRALFLFKPFGCKGEENRMEGILLESGKKMVKVLVEDEVVWVYKYRLKGSSVHFFVDPKSIVVAKV